MSKIASLFFLLISYIGFSQTEQLISGKVSYQDTYQKSIDVINYTTKKITQTNALGAFSIEAKVNDVLIFMSDTFVDQKYKLTADDFNKKVLIIKMAEKPIPLEEVEIQQIKKIKVAAVSYNDIKMSQIQKDAAKPKVEGVYTGEMVNAVDFVQIGKMIGKLFKSKNPKKDIKEEPMGFKEYALTNFNPSFFSKTLKLKPEETSRFLEYCETDSKSKTAIQSKDELTMLEFLLTKKGEFDKLK
ncbi:hypothetical protein [Flavobacterium sp. N1994]|uniref:hypothetical protein n=1 Tax=Flavobacterium sp. N1994 TaxID=2986827 RepID=UPI002221F7AE|nr:hypothetical protein [Flavobacterium sp. N1994]